jgi:fructose-bisphosphate aldolase class I
MTDLAHIAAALVAPGKGILAADETVATITKRFDPLRITSTPTSRRDFRELMLTTPGVEEFLSGVIMHDETIRQQTSSGEPFPALCDRLGILAGIKVDNGAKRLALKDGELVTEGLDNLRDRLAEYRHLGAHFAKWRAVFEVSDHIPTRGCILANANALARYAALCQEQELVPIVEPEVLMDGSHTIERCEEVTSEVQQAVFDALFEHGVYLEEMLLKPNMIVPGDESGQQVSVGTVASVTLRCLRRHAPAALPGIVFLSGGQSDVLATRHLDAINRTGGARPWRLTFSYGRALQDAALSTWRGKQENVSAAQRAFFHRSRCNSLAAVGAYTSFEEEQVSPTASFAAGWH